MAYVGLCASYDETKLFETSIMHPDNHSCSVYSYVQYVFENTVYMCTVDGKNTFHAMGGVKIVTPSSSATSKQKLVRLKTTHKCDVIGKFGFIPPKILYKKQSLGLKKSCG